MLSQDPFRPQDKIKLFEAFPTQTKDDSVLTVQKVHVGGPAPAPMPLTARLPHPPPTAPATAPQRAATLGTASTPGRPAVPPGSSLSNRQLFSGTGGKRCRGLPSRGAASITTPFATASTSPRATFSAVSWMTADPAPHLHMIPLEDHERAVATHTQSLARAFEFRLQQQAEQFGVVVPTMGNAATGPSVNFETVAKPDALPLLQLRATSIAEGELVHRDASLAAQGEGPLRDESRATVAAPSATPGMVGVPTATPHAASRQNAPAASSAAGAIAHNAFQRLEEVQRKHDALEAEIAAQCAEMDKQIATIKEQIASDGSGGDVRKRREAVAERQAHLKEIKVEGEQLEEFVCVLEEKKRQAVVKKLMADQAEAHRSALGAQAPAQAVSSDPATQHFLRRNQSVRILDSVPPKPDEPLARSQRRPTIQSWKSTPSLKSSTRSSWKSEPAASPGSETLGSLAGFHSPELAAMTSQPFSPAPLSLPSLGVSPSTAIEDDLLDPKAKSALSLSATRRPVSLAASRVVEKSKEEQDLNEVMEEAQRTLGEIRLRTQAHNKRLLHRIESSKGSFFNSTAGTLIDEKSAAQMSEELMQRAIADDLRAELRDEMQAPNRLRAQLETVEAQVALAQAEVRTLALGTMEQRDAVMRKYFQGDDPKDGEAGSGEEGEEGDATIRDTRAQIEAALAEQEWIGHGDEGQSEARAETGIQCKLDMELLSGQHANRLAKIYRSEEQLFAAVRNLMSAVTRITNFHANLEVDLSCKYCLKPMRDPQILFPCGHTFCKHCIGAMVTNELFHCAECHSLSVEGGVNNKLVHSLCSRWLGPGSDGARKLSVHLERLYKSLKQVQEEIVVTHKDLSSMELMEAIDDAQRRIDEPPDPSLFSQASSPRLLRESSSMD